MSEAIIEVQDLTKAYHRGWFRTGQPALCGVSLEVAPGQVFGLLGPNGAGKTTLIKVLLGIVRRWKGRAQVLGFPAGSVRARTRIGYLPENLRIPPHHNARTALAYYGQLAGMPRATVDRRADALLERVGLQGRDRESVGRFSKGMLQRLGLAQTLLHDPDLLILDEPTDGLDPVGRSQVRSVLRELTQQGKTIFLNSHILQEVELICDRVAILAAGRLLGSGSVAELGKKIPQADRLQVDVVLSSENAASAESEARLVEVVQQLNGQRIGNPAAGIVTLEIPIPHDQSSDRCVDSLRTAGFSIERLQRRQPSLEEVFISIVGNQSNGS